VILIVLSLLVVSIIGLLAQPLLQPGLISLRYSLFPSHTVFNVLDGEPGSLRATIADAPPGSIIIFDSSLKGHSLVLTRGNLIINKNLTILGLGEKDLILNGNGAKYHLQVNQGITVTIRGLTLTSFNSSAIKNYGTLNLVSSLVTHNRTDGNGGGIENFETGILTLEDTTVSNNAALSDDMAFIPNNVFENGGGIYNQGTLTIKNSVIVGNTARKDGGGIVNGEYSSSSTPPDQRTVTATIINSWILSNQACVVGGGIVNGEHSGMAKLNLLNSNVSFNQAGTCLSKQNTSIFGGGGIYSSTHASELTMKNSTISRNIAYHSSGTGISILGGQSTMIFCTVYENGSTGAAIAVVGGSLIMTNSIASQDRSQAISGSLTSGGYNLIQDNSGTKLKSTQPVAHDLIGVSPLLGPVPSNGGPIPLKPGGLAIDYIPINACHIDDSISDERGMPRPDNNEQNCDIGAYESSF
jgi:predicted outer membrane repeat protein